MSRDQLEGRNVVIEALRRQKRRVSKVFLDSQARRNPKVEEILLLVAQHNVQLVRVMRSELDKLSQTGVHNGVIAYADPLPNAQSMSSLHTAPLDRSRGRQSDNSWDNAMVNIHL